MAFFGGETRNQAGGEGEHAFRERLSEEHFPTGRIKCLAPRLWREQTKRVTPQELFEQLNELDEHPRIEAKTASSIGKSILETICAFANEPGMGGGWLLLGIGEAENALFPQYEITGVPDPEKLQSDLVSQCADTFNTPIRPQIQIAESQGRQYLSVFIPEAPASVKPVYFFATGLPKGAYRRIGASDIRCTEEDLAVFYQDRQPASFDSSILPDGEMEEIDLDAIAEYRRLRKETSPGAEELLWDDTELLRSLRCAEKDANNTLRPTVGGILLFGKTTALRRHFPMMRVDYIRVSGREWVEDPGRRFDTIEMRAPLIRVVGRALQAILDDLPKAFSLPENSAYRKDVPIIPSRVLREAVVNAIMHRSYRSHGAVQIIRYANRLEIRNPGYSLVSEERLGMPGSVTRNPQIAAVLHEVNLAETKGSGIRVMRQLMSQSGLTPPAFESDRKKDHFVATLLFHHFLTPSDWEWLRAFKADALTDEESRALIYVRETSFIDNSIYRELNRVDTLDASRHLRRLRDQGLLLQRGMGAATFYEPTDRLKQTVETATQPVNPDPKSVNLSAKPVNPDPKPVNLSAKPVNLSAAPSPPPHSEQELRSAFPDLPDGLLDLLANKKKKIPQPEAEQIVLHLCQWRSLRTDEIAYLLGRNRNYVTNRLITPMLRKQLLQATYPSQPNHPNQSYHANAADW